MEQIEQGRVLAEAKQRLDVRTSAGNTGMKLRLANSFPMYLWLQKVAL
jgi:hypothetical protein